MPEPTTARAVARTRSPGETEHLGAVLARALGPGDRILLYGDLGGGKTTFVRGLVRGLGHPDPREVASPTFALHHRYEGGRLPVDHLDLYRTDGGEALALQGVLDPLDDPASVAVVEWAERLPRPPRGVVLEVRFLHDAEDPAARRVELAFVGEGGGRLERARAAAREESP